MVAHSLKPTPFKGYCHALQIRKSRCLGAHSCFTREQNNKTYFILIETPTNYIIFRFYRSIKVNDFIKSIILYRVLKRALFIRDPLLSLFSSYSWNNGNRYVSLKLKLFACTCRTEGNSQTFIILTKPFCGQELEYDELLVYYIFPLSQFFEYSTLLTFYV